MAVVVTYNRKTLLMRCLAAIGRQTLMPIQIVIIDNASSDGTRELLLESGWLARDNVTWLSLGHNVGGAGGFAAGLRHTLDRGATWVWMMDDDAEPHPQALEQLMNVAEDPNAIYGSLAVHGQQTAWATTVICPPLGPITVASEVPAQAEVEMIPFLGFLIHRDLVWRIGLPDASFFIAADDAEYCLRAKRAGARVFVAGKSRIEHPKSQARTFRVFGQQLIYLSLPPWKRYYDTRNRLLIARKYHGLKLLSQTIPGSLIRLVVAIAIEERKFAQARAFFAGFCDGLFGIKGKRHESWGIKP